MPEILLGALLWDAAVGYPERLTRRVGHPVTWMGVCIAAAEERLHRPDDPPFLQRAKGGLVLAGIATLSGLVAWIAQTTFDAIPFGWVGEILAVATLLAGRSLYIHVNAVAAALEHNGLSDGRAMVARIVGRDVTQLDENGVCRAAIESLAENFSDGVVGPALAYLAFGLPGIAVYKAVNTADSMIGHRTDRHRYFGWAAARTDDVLNVVPARLTAAIIAIAVGGRCAEASAAAWRDAGKHRSPNAGWPEAAMAGALDVRLGGPRRYGDLVVDGAWLGNGRAQAKPGDIARALRTYIKAMALIVLLLATTAVALG